MAKVTRAFTIRITEDHAKRFEAIRLKTRMSFRALLETWIDIQAKRRKVK